MSDCPTVMIYTDGSCKPNPGRGGWASVLSSGEFTKEISGRADRSTSNQMELTAILEALRAVKVSAIVEIHTDSRNSILWIDGTFSINKPEILALVSLIREEIRRHEKVTFIHEAAHAGNPLNERCHFLANQESR